ncbi:MAG TPA: response regulator transcription factor [Polyangiaceae bacterium]
MPASILIVDDQTVFREMLAEVLMASGMDVVCQAGTGEDAIRECQRLQPTVVVLDVVLPDTTGLDVLGALRRAGCRSHVLLVTAQEAPGVVREGVERGARGVVMKNAPLRELKEAIQRVAAGGVYFCSSASGLLHDGIQQGPSATLSARERQILLLVARGLTSKEIAAQLGVAEKTVNNHRANIRAKLHVRDVAGLTRYAISQGMIEAGVVGK